MFKKAIILGLLLFVSACSLQTQEAPYDDVDKATGLFFERLKAGKYNEIYSDSAKSFQQRNPQPEVLENLKKMSAMGTPNTPVRMSLTTDMEEGKRMAMPNYLVMFDQNRATVILKFIDESGEWKLAAFEVRKRPN